MIKKRDGLKKEYDTLPADDQMKPYVLSKIRKIEQELQTEFYKILEDRGEEIPKMPSAETHALIDKEFHEKIKEEEVRIEEIKKEYKEEEKQFFLEELKERERQI